MAMGAQAVALDPQQAASNFRISRQNARRNAFQPPQASTAQGGQGAWDITEGANDNRAFPAEQTLNREDAYAAELHRSQLKNQLRGAQLQLPPSLSYTEEESEEITGIEEESQARERQLREESQETPVENLRPIRQRARLLARQTSEKLGNAARDLAKKQAARWAAKIGGHGIAVGDVGTSLVDGYIFGAIAFCYDMARGVVTIFVPEEISNNNLSVAEEFTKELAHKTLLTIIPPYHPLREPGDFFTFILEAIIASVALTIILACLVLIGVIIIKVLGIPIAILDSFPSL